MSLSTTADSELIVSCLEYTTNLQDVKRLMQFFAYRFSEL